MKNITLSIDEKLLEASRAYAKAHNTSLNSLVRKLLAQTVLPAALDWEEELFALMDQGQGDSGGKTWTREELYDV